VRRAASENLYVINSKIRAPQELEAAQSLAWLQDASRRDAAKLFGALKISGQLVPVRAAGAAHDTPVKIVTRVPGNLVITTTVIYCGLRMAYLHSLFGSARMS
jgi:hypothetical protein